MLSARHPFPGETDEEGMEDRARGINRSSRSLGQPCPAQAAERVEMTIRTGRARLSLCLPPKLLLA